MQCKITQDICANKKVFCTLYHTNLTVRLLIIQSVPILSPLLAAAAAKSLQSCPTLCDPIDGSPFLARNKNLS